MAAASSGPIRPPLRAPGQLIAVPSAQPGCRDFISAYADYADVLEAPRRVHEAVAVSILAALLNPRVSIEYGGLSLTLDLWTLLLSGSGFGRNTLVSLAYPILDASEHRKLIRGTAWGSGPAIYQDLAQNPTGLAVWPEMSQILKTLSQSQFMGAKEWLTDRYDNTRVPDTLRYRASGQKPKTPDIEFLQTPRLNILATSSMEWLVASLVREDTTGGFLPRWFIEHVSEPSRVIPKPRKPDRQLVKPLADFLNEIGKLNGVADLSGVERQYAEWYHAAHHRFEQQPNRALAIPFFNRLRALVLKLAVIFEASASRSLVVSPLALERAVQHAGSHEQTIFALLPTGLTAEGLAVDRIEQKIRQAGAHGISKSQLTRSFQDVKSRDRDERIKTLLDAGRVRRYLRLTGGRSPQILVHDDFRAQHESAFPKDDPIRDSE
jgi:hypothetical protein